MKIALSTDHAGFERIKALRSFLEGLGHECVYFGPANFEAQDDYPDFIMPAAKAVAGGQCEKAIIMGGSGQGEAMAANRVRGVRCAVYYGPAQLKFANDSGSKSQNDGYDIIRLSRQHNDANILSIGARFVSDDEACRASQIWLDEEFSGDERHQRRIVKLDKAE